MTDARRPLLIASYGLLGLLVACSSDETGAQSATSGPSSGSAAGAGAAGGASAQGGAGGGTADAGGSGGQCLVDRCEAYADRETCCADRACGWHHNTGHQSHAGVPPCVSSERVCMVAGREVRRCPEGTTCLGDTAFQDTEDDCTLPPRGQISLLDRGICVCE